MKKSEVTERMKELMDAPERTRLFGPPPGPPAAAKKRQRDILTTREKQDHIDMENWLHQHDLFKVHSRMDRATTNEKGIPDFVIGIRGRLVAIELKQPGNRLTPEQEEQRRKCEGPSECEYHVFYSSKDAIELLQCLLK